MCTKKIIFNSCKPYLHICLMKDNENPENSVFVTFDADSTYTPKNEVELYLLRAYAKRTESSYLIAEELDPAELKQRYEQFEAKQIEQAEAKEKSTLEARKRREDDREFYSLLRMSDKAYR
ncbi:MAG: hypothetical protein R3Y09_00095 [Clostridia bacterium]